MVYVHLVSADLPAGINLILLCDCNLLLSDLSPQVFDLGVFLPDALSKSFHFLPQHRNSVFVFGHSSGQRLQFLQFSECVLILRSKILNDAFIVLNFSCTLQLVLVGNRVLKVSDLFQIRFRLL